MAQPIRELMEEAIVAAGGSAYSLWVDPLAGVKQMPFHGVSILPTFEDANATPDRQVQYFEMLGHRGLWKEGWKVVTRHVPGKSWDDDVWELYHLDHDFSETNDLLLGPTTCPRSAPSAMRMPISLRRWFTE